jgi:hypothetical protein
MEVEELGELVICEAVIIDSPLVYEATRSQVETEPTTSSLGKITISSQEKTDINCSPLESDRDHSQVEKEDTLSPPGNNHNIFQTETERKWNAHEGMEIDTFSQPIDGDHAGSASGFVPEKNVL